MFTLCGQVPGQCRLLLHRYPNAALWSLKCPIKYSRCPIKYVQLTFSWSRQLKCFSLRVCNIIENISWTLKGTSSINNTRMPTGNKTAHLRVYYCTKNTSTGRRLGASRLIAYWDRCLPGTVGINYCIRSCRYACCLQPWRHYQYLISVSVVH